MRRIYESFAANKGTETPPRRLWISQVTETFTSAGGLVLTWAVS